MRGYSKSPLWCVGVGEDCWQAGKTRHTKFLRFRFRDAWTRIIRSDVSRSVTTEIAVVSE